MSQDTQTEQPTTSKLPRTLALLFGILVLGGYLVHAGSYFQQIDDDAYVTFRYARNFAEGLGPYFNPGERVEGYNNFFFLVQMTVASLIFGAAELPFIAKLLGVDGGLGAILGAWLLAAFWLRSIPELRTWAFAVAWIAGGLVAINSAFALHSTTGLGTVQYSALLILGLALLQFARMEDRWWYAGIFFACAVISRPEAILILLGVWIARWRAGDSGAHLRLDSFLVGGTLLAYMVFRYLAYDGQLVPNTFYAKLGGFTRDPEIGYLAAFIREHLGGIFVAFGLLPLLAGNRAQRAAVLPALYALGGGTLAIILSGSDADVGYRFLVPYAPIWAALATFGVAMAGTRIAAKPRLATFAIGILLMTALWLTQWPATTRYQAYVTMRANGYQRAHRALADWLLQRTEPGQTVAVTDPGVLGFNLPALRIRDLSGMNDLEIARAPGAFMSKRVAPDVLLKDPPEYIVIINIAPWSGSNTDPGLVIDPAQLIQRTGLEADLIRSPAFGAHYDRPRPPKPDSADPLEPLAALLGAERILMHDYPGWFYMLTVYPYDETPRATSQPADPL